MGMTTIPLMKAMILTKNGDEVGSTESDQSCHLDNLHLPSN